MSNLTTIEPAETPTWPPENPLIPQVFLWERLPRFVAWPAGVVAWVLPKRRLPCGDSMDHGAAIAVRVLWWNLRDAVLDRWGTRCPYGDVPIAICRRGYEETGWDSCACLDYGGKE
jgi:hypothetical protein